MNVHCSAVMNRHDNGRHNVICVIARKTDDDDDDSDVMVLVWRSPWMTRNMKRIVKKRARSGLLRHRTTKNDFVRSF